MRKTDAIYLFCVLICAGLFTVRSVTQSVPLFSGGAASDSAALGVAGQSHNVNMIKLKGLLERRELSDHEAEFYEPVGTSLQTGSRESETSESAVGLGHESLRTGEDR